MLEHLFHDGREDPFSRAADERSGAWSALVGIAANAAIASGGEIVLSDLAGDMSFISAMSGRIFSFNASTRSSISSVPLSSRSLCSSLPAAFFSFSRNHSSPNFSSTARWAADMSGANCKKRSKR